MARVRSFLDLNVEHLPYHGALQWPSGAVVVEMPCGWWLWVPAADGVFDPGDPETPEWLRTILDYARGLDCDYILFDADAATDDALPVYSEASDVPDAAAA